MLDCLQKFAVFVEYECYCVFCVSVLSFDVLCQCMKDDCQLFTEILEKKKKRRG